MQANEVDSRLVHFLEYLQRLKLPDINLKKLERDIKDGTYLESSIPQGYGLGSSGALVAAVYHHYYIGETQELSELKNTLSKMEGYFHGRSSGTDPLVSLINFPLVFHNDDQIEIINLTSRIKDLQIYIIDSEKKRNTAQLVEKFRGMYSHDPSFKSKLDQIVECNNTIIDTFMESDLSSIQNHCNVLSALQYETMSSFITKNLDDLWKTSLDQKNYCLKLCGAGGGGFYLCIAFDTFPESILKDFTWHKLQL